MSELYSAELKAELHPEDAILEVSLGCGKVIHSLN